MQKNLLTSRYPQFREVPTANLEAVQAAPAVGAEVGTQCFSHKVVPTSCSRWSMTSKVRLGFSDPLLISKAHYYALQTHLKKMNKARNPRTSSCEIIAVHLQHTAMKSTPESVTNRSLRLMSTSGSTAASLSLTVHQSLLQPHLVTSMLPCGVQDYPPARVTPKALLQLRPPLGVANKINHLLFNR